jgi:fucose 4-O-acetylase-like acetyltransferase
MSMLIVVFIHAYNLRVRYLQPWTLPNERLTPTGFTEYFLCNGLFRFVVPLLFLISGYLYALHDEQPYKKQIKKRMRVLLVPYLIWSAAGMIFIYVLMLFPYTRNIVINSHVLPGTNRHLMMHDYHWYDVFTKWILIPVPYQLWFIRVLIIYNLAYPFLRWCIMHKTVRFIYFTVAIFLWFITFGTLLVEGEGLLFFSLGIWMQKTNFNIEAPPKWLIPFAWVIVFLLFCTAKTWLAFEGYPYFGDKVFPLLAAMQKITVFSGLIALWYSSTRLAMWCMSRRWFMWLTGFSFIIYVMHAPAVAIGIGSGFALLHYTDGYRILTYIFLPTVIIIFSVAFGALLRRLSPKLYAFVTGGR